MPLDTVAVTKLLLGREQKRTSGVGRQIAIAHLLASQIPNIHVVFATFKNPVPWDSVDGKPVKVAALVLSPPRQLKDYFPLVMSVSKCLADESVRLSLLNMITDAQMLTVLNAAKGKYNA
jgi:mannitol/fructose-specific phosphotransferase system IIA component (Ntr-type)